MDHTLSRPILILPLLLAAVSVLGAQPTADSEFFEKNIRPVLHEKCAMCHKPELKTAGLDLSTGEGFLSGGQSGLLVDYDNPERSRILKVISYEDRLKMPPMGKLSRTEIKNFTEWVNAGAPWPGVERTEVPDTTPFSGKRIEITEEEQNFWSFRPVRDPEPPSVTNESWLQSPIDRFILARLEAKGLQPAPAAAKTTLLRRATYDLTGLPPTEKEIADFLADDSPKAFERVIDRLLSSPRYGERWGRHWLDVARYADSTGNDEDHRYPYAWRYRDYVIEAFNSDLPYDQFVREQIAGDLMPAKQPGEVNRRGIVATGLLALGPKAIAQQDKTKMLYDVYDEQVDVVSKAFMGLTVACARCHDHKFDPIYTKDYYSLISIFASTKSFTDPSTHVSKLLYTPLAPEAEYKRYTEHRDKIDSKKLEISALSDEEAERYADKLVPQLSRYMLGAYEVYQNGADAKETAAKKQLDAAILEKWVKVLKPGDIPVPHLAEWHKAKPDQLAAAAEGYQTRFTERVAEWQKRMRRWREAVRRSFIEKNMPPPERPRFEPGEDRFFFDVYFGRGPFALNDDERTAVFPEDVKKQLETLRAELKQLEETLPPEVDMACAVQEGEIVEQKVFIRGDYGSPGEDAPKGFPAVIANGHRYPETTGSGRKELAEWLTQPDHPLTSRVMVNRIWYWHFGQGIVNTPDNFGRMGERPSHPELLDYLATRFVESGWSIKKLHKMIMLSSAYQMGSRISDEAYEADPENKLFSRFNRRRLDVEEIRDGLLAMDGTIDYKMGGTLQSGFGTDRENSNDRLSLDPTSVNLRMVYVPLRRANLPALLNLFDFGDATTASGKRPHTTVAPQALFMMNSEFVDQRSENLAKELLDESSGDAARRAERAYLITLNRKPEAAEVDQALTYVANVRNTVDGKPSPHGAWKSLLRILIASNDFIYVD